ncbi:MAG: hypothetical protein GC192_21930 [Bacteroidetes bacterium]|nr:hypothetical protein [Bacteroidota bacterium]
MLTKIIFRTCTLVMLASLFSCVPEDSIMPNMVPKNQIITDKTSNLDLLENINAEVVSKDYQPTACTIEDCSSMLPRVARFYQNLADETCKEQWYCATCCLENDITTIQGYALPDKDKCRTAVTFDNVNSIPVPTLNVSIMPKACYNGGAMLLAVNPKISGNPAYSDAIYSITWYKEGIEIGSGALLSDCICGETVNVIVKNTATNQKGVATYLAKNCAENQ